MTGHANEPKDKPSSWIQILSQERWVRGGDQTPHGILEHHRAACAHIHTLSHTQGSFLAEPGYIPACFGNVGRNQRTPRKPTPMKKNVQNSHADNEPTVIPNPRSRETAPPPAVPPRHPRTQIKPERTKARASCKLAAKFGAAPRQPPSDFSMLQAFSSSLRVAHLLRSNTSDSWIKVRSSRRLSFVCFRTKTRNVNPAWVAKDIHKPKAGTSSCTAERQLITVHLCTWMMLVSRQLSLFCLLANYAFPGLC